MSGVANPAFAEKVNDPQLALIFNRAKAKGRAIIHLRNALDSLRSGYTVQTEHELIAALDALGVDYD